MKEKSIIYTNDNCQGCNRCISACPVIGANHAQKEVKEGKVQYRINVEESQCVHCGKCIKECEHNAREYQDDTEAFLEALKRGEKISVLVAPAFRVNYPNTYKKAFGALKKLGVKEIHSVSFGADITTWAYLNYIKEYEFRGGIAQPCPAIVSYVEKHAPKLVEKLMPIQSPMMCMAIYLKKYLKKEGRLAFLSPCIAKKAEIDNIQNREFVSYNVTFSKIMKQLELGTEEAEEETEYGLGCIYPSPGGLRENVEYFLGKSQWIRQVEGEEIVYSYLEQYKMQRMTAKELPFLIDALNCQRGCLYGTGTEYCTKQEDSLFYQLYNLKEKNLKKQSAKHDKKNPYAEGISNKERLKRFNQQFSKLKLEDFMRKYSPSVEQNPLSERALEEVFLEMGKKTKKEKNINCGACGYGSCKKMAEAISRKYNYKENCIHFVKDELQEEKLRITKVMKDLEACHEEQEAIYQDIFATFSQLTESISQASMKNEKNARDTQEISVAITDLTEYSKVLEDLLNEISSCLKQYESVNKEIIGISGKTNMLALNTSIESARAGEVGKGFSVIAEQVKRLSDNTKSAVQESQENSEKLIPAISQLKEQTKKFLLDIQTIQNRTKMIAATVQEVASGMLLIEETSNQLSDRMKETQSMNVQLEKHKE